MYSQGKSGREIAKILGVSKSGVNAEINRQIESGKLIEGPVITLIDVETAPALAVAFRRFDVTIGQNQIIQEGNWLISIAWRFLNFDNKTEKTVLTPDEAKQANDYRLASYLYEIIQNSDYLVGHNIKKFDWKIINLCLLRNGFKPTNKPKLIDTLEIAKSNFKFPSNKLGDLAKYLGLKVQKGDPGGIETWIKCMLGDPEALETMGVYNAGDVDLLHEVFIKLRPWSNKIPNYNIYSTSTFKQCTVCGSHDVLKTGSKVSTPTKLWNEYKCLDCGHRMRENQKGNLVNVV